MKKYALALLVLFRRTLWVAITLVILFWGIILIISGPFFTACWAGCCWFWFSSFFSFSLSFSSSSFFSFFSSGFWFSLLLVAVWSPPSLFPSFPCCCVEFFSSFSFSFSFFPSYKSFFFFLSFLFSSTSIMIGFLFPVPLGIIPLISLKILFNAIYA